MGSGTRHCQTKKKYFGIDHQDDSDSIILVVLYHNLKIQTGRCHDIFYYLQDDVLLSFFSQTESLHVHRIPARNLSFRKSPIEFFQNPNGGSLKTLAQSNHFVTSKHVGGSKKGLIISYRILTMKLRTRELRFLPVVFFGVVDLFWLPHEQTDRISIWVFLWGLEILGFSPPIIRPRARVHSKSMMNQFIDSATSFF